MKTSFIAFSRCSSAILLLLRLFILQLDVNIVTSQSIIKSLPGFFGNLPFKLETGYIGVGDSEDVQLFYYFIESETSPKDDPLVLWLTGGPGCSAFSGLVYEIGPLKFNYAKSSGKRPVFELNPYSWTKVASIIFVDQPVGTGFSYSRTWEGYNISDTISAAETYMFLRKWLRNHPQFLTNSLYVAGDSYSGAVVPIIVAEISNGNKDGRLPQMNLQGYMLGNPTTDRHTDSNSKVPFAYGHALISDELYESIKRNCKGEYFRSDPSSVECLNDLQTVSELTGGLNSAQILEPTCSGLYRKQPMGLQWDSSILTDDFIEIQDSEPQLSRPWCRGYNYQFSYIWANDETVQDALHIRQGTITEWSRCNFSLSYVYNANSSVPYHRDLIKKGYRVLVYSGDHDMVVPYVGTLWWIKSLNLTISTEWKPWFVDEQVAGYTMQYSQDKNDNILTFATVKGGGHTAPEYKPKECLAMVDRWLAYNPL